MAVAAQVRSPRKRGLSRLSLVGANIFPLQEYGGEIGLIRSIEEEKGQQTANVQVRQQLRNALALVGEIGHVQLAALDEGLRL